jgi:3'-phosphoadenosine 5'-phosphosulfate sulfotransferase (PAPS reductase)/FAD synthetase
MNDRLIKHERIALSVSGGKDSTACVYLLRGYLDRIVVYNLDTGDILPELRESVDRIAAFVPHFVRIKTDVTGWINANGLPSDLVPHSSHPIGRAMGEGNVRLASRYDCCWANLMAPLYERVRADGCTMLIRGTKRADMKHLPIADGDVSAEGVELYYPLQDWSNEQVFTYLKAQGVELPRLYDYVDQAPDCARCSAWWSEHRAGYLKELYPETFRQYDARLQLVINEIALPLAMLKREAGVG